ncbi:MAG: four helix bundle protein [Planctomycetales bacterium]|nr:four helix bundle protein [Planctomycetales bacterium]
MDSWFGFTHEKLDAYVVAREFLADVASMLAALPRGESAIADQLKRAGDSVLLNLCEGAGRPRGREKAHLYEIARGSGTECAAILDVLRVRRLAAPARLVPARARLHRVVCMLTALARRARGEGEGGVAAT